MQELTFHLEDFEGPLDLLLSLAAKHRMDLHNIPILELIDQYTRIINQAQREDPDLSSSFIEMAAHLVEMKSALLLPRSDAGERMKEELTGRLIEYELCRSLAAQLRQKAAEVSLYVRKPLELEAVPEYPLHHSPQVLANCWRIMAGRTRPAPPRQEQFELLVRAPVVTIESRVVRILRGLVTGQIHRLDQLFDRRQDLSTAVATFLAVLELIRAGRVEIGPDEMITMHKGRLPSRTRTEEIPQGPEGINSKGGSA